MRLAQLVTLRCQTLGTIVVTAILLNAGCARDTRVLPPIGSSDECQDKQAAFLDNSITPGWRNWQTHRT